MKPAWPAPDLAALRTDRSAFHRFAAVKHPPPRSGQPHRSDFGLKLVLPPHPGCSGRRRNPARPPSRGKLALPHNPEPVWLPEGVVASPQPHQVPQWTWKSWERWGYGRTCGSPGGMMRSGRRRSDQWRTLVLIPGASREGGVSVSSTVGAGNLPPRGVRQWMRVVTILDQSMASRTVLVAWGLNEHPPVPTGDKVSGRELDMGADEADALATQWKYFWGGLISVGVVTTMRTPSSWELVPQKIQDRP